MEGDKTIILLLLTIGTCAVATQAAADDQFVTVNTSSGQMRGKVDLTHIKPVVKFFGVPFAEPPIGKLRFTAPMPPLQWTGVKDALQHSDDCMQRSTQYDSFGGPPRNKSEDCLYLNVYSPPVSSPLPVMVYIHGGGYYVGSGSSFDATSLATKDVVMVTINYRLGVFGFLSTEDDIMPGNYAMMDQIAALRWVQDNIVNFGGDPNRVTIFGQSAGAGSVSLLVLSPLAKGLFQKAIMESGTSLNPWSISYPGNALSPMVTSRLVGTSVQCNDIDNTTNLLSCLQSVDSKALLNAATDISRASSNAIIMMPRVETTYGFLPDSPLKLIRQGKFNDVDSIRGFNDDEMGIVLEPYLNTTQGVTIDVAKRVLKIYLSQFNELEQDKILKLFTSYFHLDASSPIPLEKQTVNIVDYSQFIAPSIVENHEIVQRSKRNNFLYTYNYKASNKKNPEWMSAGHGDELEMVFNVSDKMWVDFFGPPNSKDIAVSKQLMEMWTNFAKTGDPTSTVPIGGAQWKPYTQTNIEYLQINATSTMSPLGSLLQQQLNFYFQFVQSLDSSLKPSNQPIITG